MWFEQMHPQWQLALSAHKSHLHQLEVELAGEPGLAPQSNLVMASFSVAPADVRVLILGQDPYPTSGVAVGRAFAVSLDTKPLPASLRNIFNELVTDVGGALPSVDLAGWQQQGVMLLNRHLTTIAGTAGAHFDAGWQVITDAAIRHLLALGNPIVLVLWGAQAKSIKKTLGQALADAASHVVIVESPHPSPLSAHRGFFGSKPFSAVNRHLLNLGQQPINWNR